MKYAAIAAHVGQFSVATMCRELGIASSGCYAWKARPPSKKAARDAALLARIRAAFQASRASGRERREWNATQESTPLDLRCWIVTPLAFWAT